MFVKYINECVKLLIVIAENCNAVCKVNDHVIKSVL